MSGEYRERLFDIPREECIELLRMHSFVGRVAFVDDDGPLALPVNYTLDGNSVVFATAAGSKLSGIGGLPVAFEADEAHPLYHSGWSVVVRGAASEVTDANELVHLRAGPLRSWARPRDDRWFRVSLDDVSGRRLREE